MYKLEQNEPKKIRILKIHQQRRRVENLERHSLNFPCHVPPAFCNLFSV